MKKIFLILAVYYFVVFLQACSPYSCGKNDYKSFDYSEVQLHNNELIALDEYFQITIIPDSVIYFAQNNQDFNLINTAFACSPVPPIEKFQITEINVYPDSIFDNSIVSEQSINNLFEIASSNWGFFSPLKNAEFENISSPYGEIKLRTLAIPVAKGREYRFTIEIVKENGTVIRATTETVIWQ